MQTIKKCRCCKSNKLIDLNYSKTFFLPNLKKKISTGYTTCSACGLIFQKKYPGDRLLAKYYETSPTNLNFTPKFEKEEVLSQLDFINQSFKLYKKTVFELGPGSGKFMELLREKFSCKVFFKELNKEAKKKILKKKFKEINRNIKFDLIVLRHVLEHIDNLESLFFKLKKLLKYDGCIFIEVPEWSTIDNKTDPLIFEHLSQFTLSSLSTFFLKNGFFIFKSEININEYSPSTPNRVIRILVKSSKNYSKKNNLKKRFFENHNDFKNQEFFNNFFKKNKRKSIAIAPASHSTYQLLIETQLRKYNLIGMFDNDPKKHWHEFEKIKIYPMTYLKKLKPEIIVIATHGFEKEIKKLITSYNLNSKILTLSDIFDKP